MDIIVLVSTKGGCGKTTIAAHLAVEAERQQHGPAAVIDADPQASLARWWNLRQMDTPTFVQTTLGGLASQLDALRTAGYQYVFIDTPGADVSHTRPILRQASLVIVPSRPSPLDLGALNVTVGMVEAERKPLMFVLNAVTARTRISTQAVVALSQHGAVGAILHQRTDYAAAMTDGRVAGELDAEGKSAEEVAQLWLAVRKHLRKHAMPTAGEEVSA